MRCVRIIALSLLLTSHLAAQTVPAADGWRARHDEAGATVAAPEVFVTMPPGWHVTTDAAGIFWEPRFSATGEFRAEMEVYLFDPEGMHEGFGLFVGGRDLEGPGQAYTYFLIRDGGQFLVKRRAGAQTPTLQDWTTNAAIRSWADRGAESAVLNTLAVEVGRDAVRFLVNGTAVASMPRAQVPADGIVGLRINHHLNLHVSRLEVEAAR